jgi:hypothetical protein
LQYQRQFGLCIKDAKAWWLVRCAWGRGKGWVANTKRGD